MGEGDRMEAHGKCRLTLFRSAMQAGTLLLVGGSGGVWC